MFIKTHSIMTSSAWCLHSLLVRNVSAAVTSLKNIIAKTLLAPAFGGRARTGREMVDRLWFNEGTEQTSGSFSSLDLLGNRQWPPRCRIISPGHGAIHLQAVSGVLLDSSC